MDLRHNAKSLNPITLLFLVWGAYLCLLFLLQTFGLPFGFRIWPLGEDHNWVGFIMDYHGKKMMHGFWNLNDRNPLSPWWWFALSPFMKHYDYAIYYNRKIIDIFLAVTTYLLLNQLYRQKNQAFTFSVALLVLTWNFSAYFEQIIWEFLGALGVSLLSIYFYCRYVDHGRRMGHELAVSLICYLIAIATYTLQTGAMIAVAGIAFFRRGVHGGIDGLRVRLLETCRDVSLYVGVFFIYCCIWYTTVREGSAYYKFNWSVFLKQITHSVTQFIYHPMYDSFWGLVRNDWSLTTRSFILLSAFLSFLGILWHYRKRLVFKNENKFTIGWTLLVLLAIATPTIIIEATSAVWYPGARSLMVQQVWQPLLYVGTIFYLVSWVPLANTVFKQTLAVILVAALGSITILFGLDYNYHMVARTHYQEQLKQGILALNIPFNKLPHLLLKLSDPNNIDLNSVSVFMPNYAQTMLKRRDFTLRPFVVIPLPNNPFWVTKFEPDKKGVINAMPYPQGEAIAYNKLLILYFDGQTVSVPQTIDKADVQGLQIEWNRNKPISQVAQSRLLKVMHED